MVEETNGEDIEWSLPALRLAHTAMVKRSMEANQEKVVVAGILSNLPETLEPFEGEDFTCNIYITGSLEEIKEKYAFVLQEHEQGIREAVKRGVKLYHYLDDDTARSRAGIILAYREHSAVRLKRRERYEGNTSLTVWCRLTRTDCYTPALGEDLGTANAKELSLEDLFG